ncbi:MAG: hypothetical protein ACFCGT_14710 [Sandaracinaceae bacterium]
MADPTTMSGWAESPERRGWAPVGLIAVSMVAFIAIKTGRDALYFRVGESRLEELALAFAYIGMASVPAAMLHLAAMDRFGVRRARVGVFVLAAVALAGLAPWLGAASAALLNAFFVAVPVIFAAVFASAWLLAGDLLEGAGAEAKARVYTRVGAASTLGGVAGGALAWVLAEVVPASGLVAVGALLLLPCAAGAALVHRRYPAEHIDAAGGEDEPPGAGRVRTLLRQPLVLTLIGISSAAAITGLLIEFQFYAAATRSGFASPEFFALFYLALSAGSFVVQLAVAPRIQKVVGVLGALMVLPVALIGVGSFVFLQATAMSRTALRVTEGGVKSSIHRAAWEQAYLAVSPRRRPRVKTLVDGASARMAEGTAALALFLWVRAVGPEGISLTLLSVAIASGLALWVGSTWWLRRVAPGTTRAPSSPEVAVRLDDACAVTSSLGPSKSR